MTIETRLRNTGVQPGGGGGGSSNSSGLAGLANLYVVTSANPVLTNSRILTAGSSTIIRTDATAIYVDAITNAAGAFNSGGLAGTGVYYLGTSANSTWPNWLVIQPGSSVTSFISGSGYYFNAITNTYAGSQGLAGTANFYITASVASLLSSYVIQAGSSVSFNYTGSNLFVSAITNAATANSGGLAGTGMFYLMSTAQTSFQNSRQVLAGSSVGIRTDGTNFYIDAFTGGTIVGGAGTGSYYILNSGDTSLPNSLIIKAGSSVTLRSDATAVYVNATTNAGGALNIGLVWTIAQGYLQF